MHLSSMLRREFLCEQEPVNGVANYQPPAMQQNIALHISPNPPSYKQMLNLTTWFTKLALIRGLLNPKLFVRLD